MEAWEQTELKHISEKELFVDSQSSVGKITSTNYEKKVLNLKLYTEHVPCEEVCCSESFSIHSHWQH